MSLTSGRTLGSSNRGKLSETSPTGTPWRGFRAGVWRGRAQGGWRRGEMLRREGNGTARQTTQPDKQPPAGNRTAANEHMAGNPRHRGLAHAAAQPVVRKVVLSCG